MPSLPGSSSTNAPMGMMRTTLPVYIRADLHAVGNALDDLASLLGGLRIGGRDVDAAVVLDVDLDAGIGDDLVDDLSAGADDFADLIGIDGEGDDLGRLLATAPCGARRCTSIILPMMYMRPSCA